MAGFKVITEGGSVDTTLLAEISWSCALRCMTWARVTEATFSNVLAKDFAVCPKSPAAPPNGFTSGKSHAIGIACRLNRLTLCSRLLDQTTSEFIVLVVLLMTSPRHIVIASQ